jgi:hypothetical protein
MKVLCFFRAGGNQMHFRDELRRHGALILVNARGGEALRWCGLADA